MSVYRPTKDEPVKPIVYFCLVMLVCIFAWHIILWSHAPTIADVEVNPLTDVVYIYVPDVTAASGLGSAFAASFKGARDLVGGAMGDKELENKVRENFDVYAMVLPYHVIFKDKKAEAPPAMATRSLPQPEPPRAELQQEPPIAPHPGEYLNSRFGFTVAIPDGFEAGEEPTNGDGNHFTSPDGRAKLTVYGSNSAGRSIKEYYDDLTTSLGVEPTYSRLSDNWFVLSGTKGDTIFCTKVFVGPASLNNFTLEYPAEQADQYRSVNDQIVRSFKHGDLDQAW
jgi:hypothetical protein